MKYHTISNIYYVFMEYSYRSEYTYHIEIFMKTGIQFNLSLKVDTPEKWDRIVFSSNRVPWKQVLYSIQSQYTKRVIDRHLFDVSAVLPTARAVCMLKKSVVKHNISCFPESHYYHYSIIARILSFHVPHLENARVFIIMPTEWPTC